MTELRLDFDENRQLALIAIDPSRGNRQWSALRRLFEERSDNALIRANTIEVPWWEFVSHRDALRFVLRTEGIALRPSDKARQLLGRARDREALFRSGGTSETGRPLEADLQSSLAAVGFDRTLMPYQARNVVEIARLLAAATFSVPGAGKTTEALAFFFYSRIADEKLLVVAPNNAFVAWEDELPLCYPQGQITRLTGGMSTVEAILRENPEFSIISYYQLPYVMNSLGAFLSRNEVCLLIDESHRMKRGERGTHGSCILTLSSLPKRKLLLSGTPMPNSPRDLVPQFRFLYPEVRTDETTVIDDIQPFFVRTTKGEIGLPPVERLRFDVEMSEPQQALYETLASDAVRLLRGLAATERIAFRSVAKIVQYMLQAASNPALLVNAPIGEHELVAAVLADGVSPKLLAAMRLTRELVARGRKVLIWSGFVRTVEHLASLLVDVGAEFVHGGVGTDDDDENVFSREAVIRRFNDPESVTRVLVANPAACSEGISLHHVCHDAIYVDRSYNAAHYLQSEDRIHRIGVTHETVTCIVLLNSPGTIDESVSRRLEAKVADMANALNDRSLAITPLPLDDETDGIDSQDIDDLREMLEL